MQPYARIRVFRQGHDHTMLRLLASALVLAGLLPGLAGAVQIYDRPELQLELLAVVESSFGNPAVYQDYGLNHNGMLSRAELGVAMRAALGGGADAVALYLNEFPGEGEQESRVRYLFAGVDGGGYGQLLFGRGDPSFYTMVGTTDIFEFIESRGLDYYQALGEQRSGLIMYALSAMGNDLRLHYQTSKDNSGQGLLSPRDTMGFSIASRLWGDFTLAYGLDWIRFSYDMPAQQTAGQNYFAGLIAHDYPDGSQIWVREAVMYAASLSYGFLGEGLYLSLLYTCTDYNHLRHHLETYEAAGAYAWENGLRVTLSLLTQRYDHANVMSDLGVGLSLDPHPGVRLFAEALLSLSGHRGTFFPQQQYLDEHQFVGGMKLTF